MISAQETTPGQVFSSWAFTSSMKSNPLKLRFGIESFSAVLFAVESSNTEAFATLRNNQPNIICMLVKMNEFAKKYMHACIEFYVRTLTKQSWKCILSNFAGNATLLATRFQVMFLIISSARGQLFL